MNDRFELLYQLPKNLYIEGAPIVILAGSLLKDKVSGSVVAQIKYLSLSEKPIKALKLDIMPMDVSGQELGDIIEYQYLDLDIRKGQDFGSNKAIVVPNTVTRLFRVVDITVIFDDGEKWFNDKQMKSLATAQSLETALGEFKMEEQYRMATNRYAVYKPMQDSDLWYCSCGLWNKSECCAKCSLRRDTAFTAFNVETLRDALNARIAEEEERARVLKEKAEEREKERKEKAKKTMMIVIPIIIVFTIIVAIILAIPEIRKAQVNDAIEKGEYLSAIGILEQIEDEEDVARLKTKVNYLIEQEISNVINDGDYEVAVELVKKYSNHVQTDNYMRSIQEKCPHESTHIDKKDATCESDGYSEKICDLCNYSDRIDYEATGHDYDTKVVKEPTCTEDGNEHKVCNICDYQEDSVIKKLGHSYEKQDIDKPTCDREGKCRYTCKTCKDSYEEIVSSKGHDWKSATCTSAKVCNICGGTEGSALGHSWNNEYNISCNRCGSGYPSKLNFVIKGGTIKVDINDNAYITLESCSIGEESVYNTDVGIKSSMYLNISGYVSKSMWVDIVLRIEDENGNRVDNGATDKINLFVYQEAGYYTSSVYIFVPVNKTYYISVDYVNS